MSLDSPKNPPEKRVESLDRLLEDIFVTRVHECIIEVMSEALEEAGFTEQEEREFRKEVSKLPVEIINGVLSLPYELRAMRLSKLHERLRQGATMGDVVQILARESRERGFTIGFHMSNADIRPEPTVNGRSGSWTIDGREQDHRDNDLPMAYYSTDLAHLYAKKRARFLYIVRAETHPDTTHRQDNHGTWGRAPKLDIIEKLDYEDLIKTVRARAAAQHIE